MMDTTPPTDFDSPWKEIIERYFPDFMRFFLPQAYAEIDWSKPYTFLDKELQQVVREAEVGPRRVDKLVKVFLKNGVETWLLIHIEVQGQREEDFARRMFVYHYRIFDRYGQEVVSLAILTDDQSGWRPNQYGYGQWGCQIRLDFPIVKLLDYEAKQADLMADDNPFAVVVLAHLQTIATRHRPQERYAAKLTLAKMLYGRGYGRQDILELFRFLDWLLTLPNELSQQFKDEMNEFEEGMKMQYVTSIERLAIEEGRQEGEQIGEQKTFRENIVDVLTIRFDDVPEEIVTQLAEITDVVVLRELLRQAVTADSLEAMMALLPPVADQDG